MIERLDDQLFLGDGACLVRDLNGLYGLVIPESDIDATLGGFLVAQLERRPCLGDVVEHAGWRYLILRVAGWTVVKVWWRACARMAAA